MSTTNNDRSIDISSNTDSINNLVTQIGQTLSPHGDFSKYHVVNRVGQVVNFNPSKIAIAITKSYIAVHGVDSLNSTGARDEINKLTNIIVVTLQNRYSNGGSIFIEDIQDQVELALMRNGQYEVAKKYVLYREERAKERTLTTNSINNKHKIYITNKDGSQSLLNEVDILKIITNACSELKSTKPQVIFEETIRNIYNGVSIKELFKAIIFASRQLIELEPEYNFVTARLLLYTIINEASIGLSIHKTNTNFVDYNMDKLYSEHFIKYITTGIENELLNPQLAEFDLKYLSTILDTKRDLQFKYLGLQTLYDRYLIHINGTRIELPQIFFMRVAMGLALKEDDKNHMAAKFYDILSKFDFMSSTPTLFNSGTLHSQLSSCYLTTISDDLAGIYDAIKENALLSKFAGGLGNDWSNIRSMGSKIKGTNGNSQGVIPFLKVVNDTAVAVNQGGKRKGAVCTYLETWHADIEEFLELRKNTGDDRRRCHDMNTANWIPDLFMQRVFENANWTLFSPNETPDLHDLYGIAFEKKYLEYENLAQHGKLKTSKTIPAVQLWRKILTMLFETGHPWITFKDPCNIRSPQQHVGVVHSSNLCTEITLNTNHEEIAVCNLGSINLVNHMKDVSNIDNINLKNIHEIFDLDKLKNTITIAMRMLDNVIDINFYPVEKAKNSNYKHRPVGLGIMGFQDCLHKLRISYASDNAVIFADIIMELIAYNTYLSSAQLAKERGTYASYQGSLWSQGILPYDTLELLHNQRQAKYLNVDKSSVLDWTIVRDEIKKYGMRNSNCIAIAPTATIANIVGISASIEPTYQNLFVKSNLSGEFTIINEYLIHDLKKHKIWDEVMLADIKYFDGNLSKIDRIPQKLKSLYATAFEIDASWIIEAASRRQKWIDQSQSLNIYILQASGKKLDEVYKLAWTKGLKTTYYLRTLAATAAEKSTGNGGELNAVNIDGSIINNQFNQYHNTTVDPKFCSIDNPECESCQ